MGTASSRIQKGTEVFVTTEAQESAFLLRIEADEIRLAVYIKDGFTSGGVHTPEWTRELVTTFIDIFLTSNPAKRW